VLDVYLADVARCATVNQFNRLHILLENVLAPAEVTALIDGVRERGLALPQPAAHWLARLDTLLRANGRRVQPYARHTLAEGATVYAAPGTTTVRAARTLVIAFTGDASRLMMPLALLLQHCPAERYEFVVLVDRKRSLYLNGVAGLGTDLPSTIARLAELAAEHARRGAACYYDVRDLRFARCLLREQPTPPCAHGDQLRPAGLTARRAASSARSASFARRSAMSRARAVIVAAAFASSSACCAWTT